MTETRDNGLFKSLNLAQVFPAVACLKNIGITTAKACLTFTRVFSPVGRFGFPDGIVRYLFVIDLSKHYGFQWGLKNDYLKSFGFPQCRIQRHSRQGY